MIRASAWKECVIAASGQLSAVCDLGRPYENAIIQIPTIDSSTLVVRASRTATGTGVGVYITHDQTAVPVALNITAGTGGFMWIVPLMGVQYLWLYAGSAQTGGARTFYVRGFNGASIVD